MGSNDPATLISEQAARQQAEQFIVCPGRGTDRLHLRHPHSSPDHPEPLCRKHCDAGWQCRAVTAYPPGYYPICRDCRKQLTNHGD